MKSLPFIVQKFVFRDDPALQHFGEPPPPGSLPPPDQVLPFFKEQIEDKKNTKKTYNKNVRLINSLDGNPSPVRVPGYFVMSNAPPNIEEALEAKQEDLENAAKGIEEIVNDLYRIQSQNQTAPELVITVHGYNTSLSSVQSWYKDIFQYTNRYDGSIYKRPNQVFIGYRWPSENVEPERFSEALRALPPLPRDLLISGVIGAIALLILQFLPLEDTLLGFALALLLTVFVLLASLMLALVVLRLVVYFRDNYRANNFGVPDLVELIRQVDRGLVERKATEIQANQPNTNATDALNAAVQYWQNTPGKVRLSFIGHSMGAFVVTNVVRILSDVFDARSIEKEPPPDIGSVFCLQRLVLASPDIPVLTIISSRANFLDSSLRRFAESYLFSSEGDIALRIASTAANYISFPSSTQSRGYRLGNVAIPSRSRLRNNRRDYGLVNLTCLDQHLVPGIALEEAIAHNPEKVLDHLFITSQRHVPGGYVTLGELFEDQSKRDKNKITVADFFTFFDCTDYKDVILDVRHNTRSAKEVGLLTRAKGQGPLNSLDYLLLTLDYGRGVRDVHGGYFQGDFSQQLLYRIAFLGFTGYLKTLDGDETLAFDPHAALSKLHLQCREKGIQGFLSPIRYRVDIQGHSLRATQGEMLEAIGKEEPAAQVLDPSQNSEATSVSP